MYLYSVGFHESMKQALLKDHFDIIPKVLQVFAHMVSSIFKVETLEQAEEKMGADLQHSRERVTALE